MRGWHKIVESVLRPARPHLERCLAARESHLAARRLDESERARALRDCVQRIERERAVIFAANDGVVPAAMTDLEREWRALARVDRERGMMDLWARIAPAAWIDRKLWRDSDERVDAAIALASDVDGVEAAESAVRSLRTALATWGTTIGPRVRFRMHVEDSSHCEALLEAPLRAVTAHANEHAQQLEVDVHAAVLTRFPDRPCLARDLAHAAFADYMVRNAALPNPVIPLRALWTTGYTIAAIDVTGITLEVPAL